MVLIYTLAYQHFKYFNFCWNSIIFGSLQKNKNKNKNKTIMYNES